jgi:hypothetical protein
MRMSWDATSLPASVSGIECPARRSREARCCARRASPTSLPIARIQPAAVAEIPHDLRANRHVSAGVRATEVHYTTTSKCTTDYHIFVLIHPRLFIIRNHLLKKRRIMWRSSRCASLYCAHQSSWVCTCAAFPLSDPVRPCLPSVSQTLPCWPTSRSAAPNDRSCGIMRINVSRSKRHLNTRCRLAAFHECSGSPQSVTTGSE